MTPESPVVEMTAVVKNYSTLRPLRIASLSVARTERVAIGGIDAVGAEVFLNLVTGASLPDGGEIRVFGQSTAAVADGDEWLASLDRFGIVSERAVILEAATVAQNLALPFTLEIDPLTSETRARVRALAEECDIAPAWIERHAGDIPAEVRARIGFMSNNTGIYDRMTAWEMVAYFGRLYGLAEDLLRERMESLFERLKMNDFRDVLPAAGWEISYLGPTTYQVNLSAEMKVAHLHEKVDHLQIEILSRLSNLERAAGVRTSAVSITK